MKKIKITQLLFILITANIISSCKVEGELLWVKYTKGGKPPVCVSNYSAKKNDSTYNFQRYDLNISHENDIIYYKSKKIFDSSLFLNYKNECIELYKNSIIMITDRKIGEDLPMEIMRTEIIFIDLSSPSSYYILKLKEPINLLSSEVIELSNSSTNINKKYDGFQLKRDYNFQIIKEINLRDQTIIFNKVNKENGLYKVIKSLKDMKMTLEKHNNPLFN